MKPYQRITFIVGLVVSLGLMGSNVLGRRIVELPADVKLDGESGSFSVLKGLKGVQLAFSGLSHEVEKDGLTTEKLRKDLELKLRIARIKILPASSGPHDDPILFVLVNIIKAKSGGYIHYIEIELHERVRIMRNPELAKQWADTWESNSSIERSPTLDHIRSYLKDRMDDFLFAYVSANPK